MDEKNIERTFGDLLTFGDFVNKVLQSLMNLASFGIGLVNINRVTFHSQESQDLVHKSRNPLGWILIVPGNQVFRLRYVPVRVLHKHEWMRWESDVKLVTRNEKVVFDRSLVCKKISGESLSVVLQNDMQYSEKKELVCIAIESLKKFHETEIIIEGAGRCLLSHGDASIANVLYDQKTKLAEWFDFDLRHDFRCDAVQRHADDLRALMFSAVHKFEVDWIEDLIRTLRAVYPKDEVWIALAKQISSRWFAVDIFHHSQMARVRKTSVLPAKKLKQLDWKLKNAISDFAEPESITSA